MIDPTQRMRELLDNQFRLLEERIEYNRHDMGEMGMFIRVGYVKNFLEETKAQALAELSKLLDEVRIDERETTIAQLDGVYQVCVRDEVLTPDGLNGYHCAIEDACKDRDDLKAALQQPNPKEG